MLKTSNALHMYYTAIRIHENQWEESKVKSELAASGVQYLQRDHQLIISAHVFIIIFYMLIPGLVGGFGNYLLLVQIRTLACFKNSIQWLSF